MNLVNHIKRQWNEYPKIYEYLRDLREGKITRSRRWNYLNPNIKNIDDEVLLENIVNNFIFLAYVIRHPVKFGVSYLRSLEEGRNPSPF